MVVLHSVCYGIISILHVPLTVITANDLKWCDEACFKLPAISFILQSSRQKLCCLYLMSYPVDELTSAESVRCEHTLMNVKRSTDEIIVSASPLFSLFHPSVSPAFSSSMVFLLFSVIFANHHLSFSLCLCVFTEFNTCFCCLYPRPVSSVCTKLLWTTIKWQWRQQRNAARPTASFRRSLR